ncbi:17211_t:CDS:2 [Dentiscutata heterogama]|uniref:17211_t:CDS:1 n=1 Tax=Dentiscutata heterogama TaxID=1316150 RepID=A0ACA9L1Z6_9GLOM|nr:17211_t:CDS:2 [Dentiscutata heterogama]
MAYFNAQDSQHNLDHLTISKILKEKNKWLAVSENEITSSTFRYKKVKFSLLDQAIKLWVEQVVNNRLFLTEAIIKEKAAYFFKALSLPDNEIKFSNGWIRQFKKCNSL